MAASVYPATAQYTELLPAVEIYYPKNIDDDARASESREERREHGDFFLKLLTVVAVFGWALAYRQWQDDAGR